MTGACARYYMVVIGQNPPVMLAAPLMAVEFPEPQRSLWIETGRAYFSEDKSYLFHLIGFVYPRIRYLHHKARFPIVRLYAL